MYIHSSHPMFEIGQKLVCEQSDIAGASAWGQRITVK